MEVTLVHSPRFDAIFSDPNFGALCECFTRSRLCRVFVTRVVYDYPDGVPLGFEAWSVAWGALHLAAGDEDGSATDDSVSEAARRLDALYRDHGGTTQQSLGNLRGAILEGLVVVGLAERYVDGQLLDNVEIGITDNGT